MSQIELQQSIQAILCNLRRLRSLKEPFAELNYDRVDQPLSRRDWTEDTWRVSSN